MPVCHLKAVDLRGVARNRIFRDGIYNLFSAAVLLKTAKCTFPAIGLCNTLAGLFCTVRKKMNGDSRRTFSVLIIRIIPYLGYGNGNLSGTCLLVTFSPETDLA